MSPMTRMIVQFLWDLLTLFAEFFTGLFEGDPAAKSDLSAQVEFFVPGTGGKTAGAV